MLLRWCRKAVPTATHSPALHALAGLLGLAIFFLSLKTDESLHRIHEHLTTHYVGEFPGSPFLPEITGILTEARNTIGIACDVPGYGMYSNYPSYIQYKTQLLKKQNDLKRGRVRIVILSPDQRAALLSRYVPDNMNMDVIRQSPIFQELVSRHPGTPIRTPAELRRVREEDQRAAWRAFSALNRRKTNSPMPLHLWIVDETVAIFTIPHPTTTGMQESAFLTRDSRLIGRMKGVFESYWTSGTDEDRPVNGEP